MGKGRSEIPDLRLETLNDFLTLFKAPPELRLQKMFPSKTALSSSIKWESSVGGRGMAPFMAPGQRTPKGSRRGIASHSAEAAMWGEALEYDEEFLNNLRKPGTEAEYQDAQSTLAEGMADLTNRAYRRREWMYSRMLTAGSFTYNGKDNVTFTVNYGIPSTHIVTLTADQNWEDGSKRQIIKNCITAKRTIKDDCGGIVTNVMCNDSVLEYMSTDSDLLTLLSKTGFGKGNLFEGSLHDIVGTNPGVIGSLLNLGTFEVHDEVYELRETLTGAVTGNSTTTISVSNSEDFEADMTIRFNDKSAGTYEDCTIASVDASAGTITLDAAPVSSYKSGEDYVSVFQPFIPDNTIIFFASRIEGQPIAKYHQAPHGIPRGYGLRARTKYTEDPDMARIWVNDKGLPVLYQRDAVYILKVK